MLEEHRFWNQKDLSSNPISTTEQLHELGKVHWSLCAPIFSSVKGKYYLLAQKTKVRIK